MSMNSLALSLFGGMRFAARHPMEMLALTTGSKWARYSSKWMRK